jgi:hypothetical protein
MTFLFLSGEDLLRLYADTWFYICSQEWKTCIYAADCSEIGLVQIRGSGAKAIQLDRPLLSDISIL